MPRKVQDCGSLNKQVDEICRTSMDKVRGDTMRAGANSTGANTATLGSNNFPSSNTTPYTWIDVYAVDGTLCVMPIWKKE